MTAFRKTILGKILGGVAKVALPVVGGVVGLGAITGAVKGVGAITGIGKALAKGKQVIDKVGGAAVNLVTGTTKLERDQVQEQKKKTRAAINQLEQVDRLVKAGATPAEARLKVGLSEAELTSYNGEPTRAGIMDYIKGSPVVAIAGALLLLFVVPKLLKKGRR